MRRVNVVALRREQHEEVISQQIYLIQSNARRVQGLEDPVNTVRSTRRDLDNRKTRDDGGFEVSKVDVCLGGKGNVEPIAKILVRGANTTGWDGWTTMYYSKQVGSINGCQEDLAAVVALLVLIDKVCVVDALAIRLRLRANNIADCGKKH